MHRMKASANYPKAYDDDKICKDLHTGHKELLQALKNLTMNKKATSHRRVAHRMLVDADWAFWVCPTNRASHNRSLSSSGQ